MGLSNKATNKFARFTATKPPLFKYNRLGASKITKKGLKKIVSVPLSKEDLINKIKLGKK